MFHNITLTQTDMKKDVLIAQSQLNHSYAAAQMSGFVAEQHQLLLTSELVSSYNKTLTATLVSSTPQNLHCLLFTHHPCYTPELCTMKARGHHSLMFDLLNPLHWLILQVEADDDTLSVYSVVIIFKIHLHLLLNFNNSASLFVKFIGRKCAAVLSAWSI